MYYAGFKIVESADLVAEGKPYLVERTWREKLLTKPWRPWVLTKVVIPMVPDDHVYKVEGTLLMHPVIAAQLRASIRVEFNNNIKTDTQDVFMYGAMGIRRGAYTFRGA